MFSRLQGPATSLAHNNGGDVAGTGTKSRQEHRRSSIISSRGSSRDGCESDSSILQVLPDLSGVDEEFRSVRELDFYYGIVKRTILCHQSLTTGLFPANSADTKMGSVRDTIYCCMAMWSLYLGYKKIDEVKGRGFEMRQSCVAGLQGILKCWMRQAGELEKFKTRQSDKACLHVLFDLDTGFPVKTVDEYGHLQLDVVSLFLLVLVQTIESELEIVCNMDEISFVQNLVYYVERTYRTADFGMWERGSSLNDNTCEIHASSVAMAKACLEAINGFNLYGRHGAAYSTVYVDVDAHNRNRMILETLLPRESATKTTDASLLTAISFPAFATHNEELYRETKDGVLKKLSSAGNYGLKRFIRDGYGSVLEPEGQRFCQEGKTKDFEGIESEWPLFYAYLIIDGIFTENGKQVEEYQKLLKDRLFYTENGDPLIPKYYYVTRDNVSEEKLKPGTTQRNASSEGSKLTNVFLWGQALLIIADLLTTKIITNLDLDPISRHLPPHMRTQSGNKANFENPKVGDVTVQIVLISESSQLQAMLNTFGIQTQTPEEVEPVQIWSHSDMVKVFSKLGKNEKLGITGRPSRPIGVLGTGKFYRVMGQMVLCYPLTMSQSEFYLSRDLGLLCSNIRTDLEFLSQRWRVGAVRPTYCILVTETNMKDPQFYELLDLLIEIRMLRIEGVTIQLGRLQNLISSASVESLDYTNHIDMSDFKFEPFKQTHHKFLGYDTLSDFPKVKAKVEEPRDFVFEFKGANDNIIINEYNTTNHMLGKIQLLGVLLARHGPDFGVGNSSVVSRLERMNHEAGNMRYWKAVRYSASLLKQIVDSISPYVTQILVNGKQVTVGTIGECSTLFSKPMTPSEMHEAIYTKVQPFNMISAVLQQELIIYCGKLIVSNPELFSGMIKVRMGWVLRAVEIYHELTAKNEEERVSVENLSPSKIRQLTTDVFTESQIIKNSFDPKAAARSPSKKKTTPLTVFQARQINGCLVQTPTGFYSDVWVVLQKCPEGIRMREAFLPQEPTLSNLSAVEEMFAHAVENMLNEYRDPVRKQMVVECLSVVAIVIKRHPELKFKSVLDVQNLIDKAIALYKSDKSLSEKPEAVEFSFMNEAVSLTSVYFAKAVINFAIDDGLSGFLEMASSSTHECPIQ